MARKVRSGDREELITIEAPTNTSDGYGGSTVTWSLHVTAWVRVRSGPAREDESQGAERASCRYFITGQRDALATVTPAMRVNRRGTYLNIREVPEPPPRSLNMLIVAESGVTV